MYNGHSSWFGGIPDRESGDKRHSVKTRTKDEDATAASSSSLPVAVDGADMASDKVFAKEGHSSSEDRVSVPAGQEDVSDVLHAAARGRQEEVGCKQSCELGEKVFSGPDVGERFMVHVVSRTAAVLVHGDAGATDRQALVITGKGNDSVGQDCDGRPLATAHLQAPTRAPPVNQMMNVKEDRHALAQQAAGPGSHVAAVGDGDGDSASGSSGCSSSSRRDLNPLPLCPTADRVDTDDEDEDDALSIFLESDQEEEEDDDDDVVAAAAVDVDETDDQGHDVPIEAAVDPVAEQMAKGDEESAPYDDEDVQTGDHSPATSLEKDEEDEYMYVSEGDEGVDQDGDGTGSVSSYEDDFDVFDKCF